MRNIILVTSAAVALVLGAGVARGQSAAGDVQSPSLTQPPPAPSDTGVQPGPAMEPTRTDPTLNPEYDPSMTGTGSLGTSDAREHAAEARQHVVQAGDTLSALAERYLGSADEWERIADANGIADPTKLEIGTRLSIPKDAGGDEPGSLPRSGPQPGVPSGDRS